MKLTSKCLDAFLAQLPNEIPFYDLPESCQNALVVDWFDSVGIYICPVKVWGKWRNFFDEDTIECNTRPEAINAAIEKANDLYNSENK